MKIRVESYAPEGFIALDNSALIYPPTETAYTPNTFRISVDLTVDIDTALLKAAALQVLERCPYARVELKRGFFWYYLTPNPREIPIIKEGSYPCGRFLFEESAGYLFKIIYGKRRIALECFHALTDGSGALAYLKLLLERYFALSGGPNVTFDDGLSYEGGMQQSEFSDPFQELYNPALPPFPTISGAYHRKGTGRYSQSVKVIRASVQSQQLKERAKARQLTVGEYLSTVYLYTLQQLQEREVAVQRRRKPIRLSVPINLRRIFRRQTMRNFTLFGVIGIQGALGHYSFDEIATEVRLQMAQSTSSKQLLSQIRRNVAGQRSPLLRFVPTAVKNPFFKLLSDALGDRQYSGIITNLGYVKLPEELASFVTAMDFHLSCGLLNRVAIAVIGYLDTIAINFTSYLDDDTELERLFLTFLVEDGVAVEIATNREVR